MKNYVLPCLLFLLGASLLKKGNAGIYGMSKSKFLPPYTPEGKTTYRDANNKSGVYLIKEKGKVVYVGYSGKNIYRTLYRHFQKWDHPYQKVTTYASRDNYTVRVILTTPAQAERLEAYLVNKYQPRDNDIKLKAYAEKETGKEDFAKMKTAEDYEPAPF